MGEKGNLRNKSKELDGVDLAKFIFAFSVIYIHAGGTVTQPILASCINAFNSLAVPFFFIAAGYFFFERIESLDDRRRAMQNTIC